MSLGTVGNRGRLVMACNHTDDEQARMVALDFATRLRSVETTDQAIKAAEEFLKWLKPSAPLRVVK